MCWHIGSICFVFSFFLFLRSLIMFSEIDVVRPQTDNKWNAFCVVMDEAMSFTFDEIARFKTSMQRGTWTHTHTCTMYTRRILADA